MSTTLNDIIKPIEGCLLSINRNTINGWYEIEIGIPENWIFDSNEHINCTVLNKSSVGVLLKIYPNNDTVTIDNLIDFVKIIIEINKKIEERENEFNESVNKLKLSLEKEREKYLNDTEKIKSDLIKMFKKYDVVNKLEPDDKTKNKTKIKKSETTSDDNSFDS